IEVVNRIKHLRTEEKLTIAGARTKLTMRRPSESKETMVASARTKTLIGQIRKDIEDILKDFS
nr:hypothetical protein [candidate division Zixibacteria bacterium]